jgi:hypothetical protein
MVYFSKLNFVKVVVLGLSLSITLGLTSCKKESKTEAETEAPAPKTFCYTFTKSEAKYDSIVGGKVSTLNLNDLYEVPIGFSFNFCGKTFTDLYMMMGSLGASFTYLDSDGYIDLSGYELIADGVVPFEDDFDSKIKYITTGAAGNRVTTVEFRDYKYSDNSSSATKKVNMQIKLYENGSKVEYHFGPNDMTTVFSNNELIMGMYSGNMNNGVYLYGPSSNPTSTYSYNGKAVATWPSEGTLYKFN